MDAVCSFHIECVSVCDIMTSTSTPHLHTSLLIPSSLCLNSEECRKPQPPLLFKRVLQYTSNLYCNTPPIFIAVLSVPLGLSGKGTTSVRLPFVTQYASHLYRSTPPICIAMRLPFVSQYLWENLGGCGHRDVPH